MEYLKKERRRKKIDRWYKYKFKRWIRQWGLTVVGLCVVAVLLVAVVNSGLLDSVWKNLSDTAAEETTVDATDAETTVETETTADAETVAETTADAGEIETTADFEETTLSAEHTDATETEPEETETEPEETETEPTEETVIHKRWEFEVELPVYPDRYLIFADEVELVDGSYCIRGKQVYGGDLLIRDKQKALLDYGAVMRVTYEGEEVLALVSELVEREDNSYIRYVLPSGQLSEISIRSFVESRMGTADPDVLRGMFQLVSWGGVYNLVLEEEYQLTVPADTLIYPFETYLADHWEEELGTEDVPAMTMKEFYDLLTGRGAMLNCYYRIYMEDGVIAKIEQEVRP